MSESTVTADSIKMYSDKHLLSEYAWYILGYYPVKLDRKTKNEHIELLRAEILRRMNK